MIRALSLSAVVGAIIGGAEGSIHPPQLFGLALGALSGAITGAILAVVIVGGAVSPLGPR